MKKARKTLRIALDVFIWLFVVFAVIITVLVISAQNPDGVPTINGKCVINILSDSMSPNFKKGDIIIGKVLDADEKYNLQAGDVITFYSDLNGDGIEELNTHRITKINYDPSDNSVLSYTTKGDNTETNMSEDSGAVLWQKVICEWTGGKISGAGSVVDFLRTSKGFLICIVLPLVLLFLYTLYRFFTALMKIRNTGKKQITAADEALIKQQAVEEYLRQKESAEKQNNKVEEQEETADKKPDTEEEDEEENPKI